MLAHYLSTELMRIGRASALALLLLSKINWQRDAEEFGPRGSVNHLTVRKMADALGCSPSTVQEHLALLRSAGIIESEPVADRKGSICYCRMWFSGFVAWLQKRASVTAADNRPQTGTPGQGGSEKPEGNLNIKSSNIIDLDIVKTARFTSLEALIREAGPKLSDGKPADCEMVFQRFRLFNLKQGKSQIAIAALRGFARSFTDFRGKAAQKG
ncbi:MAG: ArsR family transcriptional regulator, partial [Chthoniobacteraceae bacterium]|nr:ArsR family transcriptional regulator [Chthoniobacteraceae bacterium]